ncbi:LacI family DNA-binding transcriptional regulator [Paenibacillus mendelii]|uniref:LacI family DNA-binding transcriptional regulator n=1 Tax=Paenibacillus mendelii TaxID=206163 RepID=A0ABV6J4N0_9BACL|nr:LacI family DNA-binding transcriptional regulator [Paenibacillus mendelii]MCQ6560479.1 LacI family transcriptional regulator [Paenibacillus mendelii]
MMKKSAHDRTTAETRSGNATINDVAKAAGVGRSTVSRVINNSPSVDDATRRNVLKVMEELRYVPRASARGNRLSRSHSVGYVFGLPKERMDEDPFHAIIFQGVADACRQAGLNILYFTDDSMNDPQSATTVLEAARSGMVDGFIAVLAHDSWLLKALEEWSVPTVLIDPQHAGSPFPWIGIDNAGAMMDTVRRLQALGHRKIAFIAGEHGHGTIPLSFRERLAGYRVAMEEQWTLDESLIVVERMDEGIAGVAAGFKGARKLLDSGNKPDAIVAANDLIAFGVMQLLYERNVRIPDEMSVLGFDDVPAAGYMAPALSTVHVPKELLGRKAVEAFIELYEGTDGKTAPPECLHRVQAQWVNRGTVADRRPRP